MCHHNYTSHNGCGHVGESHTRPWTLCSIALQRLNDLRGPSSPPVSSPPASFAPPKRGSSSRRFFSLSGTLSRSSTSASSVSRRAWSTPGVSTPRTSISTSSYRSNYIPTTELDYSTLPDHQLIAVRCADPIKHTHVSREMNVCKSCLKSLCDMRSMLARYDKTGSIRGTGAFEKFLKWEGESAADVEGDVTVPVRIDEGGAFGARQAIIMGVPESALNKEGPRGLSMMARREDDRYFAEKY